MQIKSRYPLVDPVSVSARKHRAVAHKVRMESGLLGGDTTGRVVFEHGFEQVNAVAVEARDELAEVLALPFGKGSLEVWE